MSQLNIIDEDIGFQASTWLAKTQPSSWTAYCYYTALTRGATRGLIVSFGSVDCDHLDVCCYCLHFVEDSQCPSGDSKRSCSCGELSAISPCSCSARNGRKTNHSKSTQTQVTSGFQQKIPLGTMYLASHNNNADQALKKVNGYTKNKITPRYVIRGKDHADLVIESMAATLHQSNVVVQIFSNDQSPRSWPQCALNTERGTANAIQPHKPQGLHHGKKFFQVSNGRIDRFLTWVDPVAVSPEEVGLGVLIKTADLKGPRGSSIVSKLTKLQGTWSAQKVVSEVYKLSSRNPMQRGNLTST